MRRGEELKRVESDRRNMRQKKEKQEKKEYERVRKQRRKEQGGKRNKIENGQMEIE